MRNIGIYTNNVKPAEKVGLMLCGSVIFDKTNKQTNKQTNKHSYISSLIGACDGFSCP